MPALGIVEVIPVLIGQKYVVPGRVNVIPGAVKLDDIPAVGFRSAAVVSYSLNEQSITEPLAVAYQLERL